MKAVYLWHTRQGRCAARTDTGGTGTTITFWPDSKIFESTEFFYEDILKYLRRQAYLTKKVFMLTWPTNARAKRFGFYFEGGIKSYVMHLNRGAKLL